jgi:hypothetical protein
MVSNLVSNLSGVTGTGSGGGDNPPSAWAVKDYVDTELDKKQGTLTAGTNISISSGTISCTYSYTLPTATASVLGGVKVGSNISVSSGTISVADATTSTKGVVTLGDHNAISNSNSASPGGAAQCYAVKAYVADQFDAISGTYVMVSNLVSNLSGVTGTGSGGGDNPPTAWAVKQALASCITFEELT